MSQQSTNESDDLAVHTILDEVHDELDGLEDPASSLGASLSRIASDAQQFRHLPAAGAREERAYLLEHAARVVHHIDLIDRQAAAERAEVAE